MQNKIKKTRGRICNLFYDIFSYCWIKDTHSTDSITHQNVRKLYSSIKKNEKKEKDRQNKKSKKKNPKQNKDSPVNMPSYNYVYAFYLCTSICILSGQLETQLYLNPFYLILSTFLHDYINCRFSDLRRPVQRLITAHEQEFFVTSLTYAKRAKQTILY